MPRMKMGPKGKMKKPGGMLKKPNTPGEKGRMVKGMITKALADLRKQQQQEAQDLENAKKERIRKIAGNLIGPKSTQSKQLEGFTGFRDDDDEDELGMKNRSKNKTMGRIKIGY